MKNFIVTSLTLLSLCFSGIAQEFKADDILGQWYTEEGKSVVEIFKKGDKYFGKILWLKEPNDKNGKPLKDTKNPDEKLRSRTIKGITFMFDFEFDDDEWEDGKVYDPESGNTYSGTITLESKDIMNLRGYVGFSMFGRTSTWVRKKK